MKILLLILVLAISRGQDDHSDENKNVELAPNSLENSNEFQSDDDIALSALGDDDDIAVGGDDDSAPGSDDETSTSVQSSDDSNSQTSNSDSEDSLGPWLKGRFGRRNMDELVNSNEHKDENLSDETEREIGWGNARRRRRWNILRRRRTGSSRRRWTIFSVRRRRRYVPARKYSSTTAVSVMIILTDPQYTSNHCGDPDTRSYVAYSQADCKKGNGKTKADKQLNDVKLSSDTYFSNRKPEGISVVGDLTEYGHAKELRQWVRAKRLILERVMAWMSLGNHDVGNNLNNCHTVFKGIFQQEKQLQSIKKRQKLKYRTNEKRVAWFGRRRRRSSRRRQVWGKIIKFGRNVGRGLKTKFNPVGKWFKTAGKNTGNWFKAAGKDTGDWLKQAGKDTAKWSKGAWNAIASTFYAYNGCATRMYKYEKDWLKSVGGVVWDSHSLAYRYDVGSIRYFNLQVNMAYKGSKWDDKSGGHYALGSPTKWFISQLKASKNAPGIKAIAILAHVGHDVEKAKYQNTVLQTEIQLAMKNYNAGSSPKIAAVFYGHIHQRLGYYGTIPTTTIPYFYGGGGSFMTHLTVEWFNDHLKVWAHTRDMKDINFRRCVSQRGATDKECTRFFYDGRKQA